MKRIGLMVAVTALALLPTTAHAQTASASDAEQQEIKAQAAPHGLTVSGDFAVPYTMTSTDQTDTVDIVTVQLSDSSGGTGNFVFACETQTDQGATQFQCDFVNVVIVSTPTVQ